MSTAASALADVMAASDSALALRLIPVGSYKTPVASLILWIKVSMGFARSPKFMRELEVCCDIVEFSL